MNSFYNFVKNFYSLIINKLKVYIKLFLSIVGVFNFFF